MNEADVDWKLKYQTLQSTMGSAIERTKEFKTNFGVKERSDGSLVIDYEKLVINLGLEGAMELRAVIDETYNVSGAAGEKPHIKLANG